jgi:hypothetical protein
MAVTADNATLIVADSYRHQLVGFDIQKDGGLEGRRIWADLGEAAPDGICVDRRRRPGRGLALTAQADPPARKPRTSSAITDGYSRGA